MTVKHHRERWAQNLGASSGAKAVEAPKAAPAKPYTPDLLKRIWDLKLDKNPRWRDSADLWPCVEAAEGAGLQEPEILEVQADLLLERTALNARRFLRAVQAHLSKARAR